MRAPVRASLALLAAGVLHGALVVWLSSVHLKAPATDPPEPLELTIEIVSPPPVVVEKPPERPSERPAVEEPPALEPPPRKVTKQTPPAPEPPKAAPPEEPAAAPVVKVVPEVPPRLPPAPRAPVTSTPRAQEPAPKLKRTGDGRLVHDAHRFKAEIQKDGSVRFEDKPDLELFAKDLPLGSVRFDVNDALWRLIGRDPYLSQKNRFMKSTEGLRVAQAMAHAEEILGPALDDLAASLEELLVDTSRSAAEKRATVFELWDECNDERAGQLARAIIESFVRARMPRGSQLGFSDDELARLNEGSAARFRPYVPRALTQGAG